MLTFSRLGRGTYVGAVGIALVLGILALWIVLRPVAAARSETRPVVAVSVAKVAEDDVPQLLTAIGNVQSLNNVTLRPQIDGVLREVFVREGQSVRRGQLLARIDDRAMEAAVLQARAEQSRNEANLKIALLDLKRDENLLAGEAISRQTVEEQRATVEELMATVQSNAAAIQAAEVQRSYTRIVSPVTGRVGIRRVDPGNLVHANDSTGLFTVVQMDPISVVFALPQQDLPRLQPLVGNPSGAKVTAFDRDAGTVLTTGSLMTLDNQIDAATGTLQLRALFANSSGRLWPGQFVTVQLQTGVDRHAVVVNSRAVQHGLDGAYVFTVRDGSAKMVPVTVRYQQGAIAAIGSGLRPGDTVVTDGQSQLKDGSAIKIVSEVDAAAQASPTQARAGIAPL